MAGLYSYVSPVDSGKIALQTSDPEDNDMISAYNSAINYQQQMMYQQQQMQGYGQMGYGYGPTPGSFGDFSGIGGNPTGFQGNIADAQVGGSKWGGFLNPFQRPTEGYALDFNRNGRYDRGRDGVLVFDTNRDGKYDKKDVQGTNNMMQSVTGNYDFNNDGRVSMGERLSGASLRRQYQQLDRNRDGVLSQQEMSAGGGRVWIDSSRGGGVSANELHSVNSIPGGGIGRPRQEVDFVNPFNRTSHTSNAGWNQGPIGGGWNPGGGMGPWGGGWNSGGGSWGGGGWNPGGMGPWGGGFGAPSYPMGGMGY